MPLCGVSPKLPYCVVITSIFLKIWNGRESHQDIKACSKRQTASIVLFQDFQRGTIMYCNHLARIDSSIKPRSIVVVMKIRVSVSSLSKVQLRYPWQESVFVQKRIVIRCLHTPFYVRISHRRPSRNSHFVLLLLYIGFFHARETGVAGLDNMSFLVHPI